MKEIKISFCLPCYNVEKYIVDCLKSIEAQELDKDEYEILCVDDCATDNTYQIILSYSKDHPNLRLLKNEKNLGLSATRNELLKNAKGKYIWFIDSDDMLTKGSAKCLMTIAETYNVDAVVSNLIKIPDNASFDDFNDYVQDVDINNVSEITHNIMNIRAYYIDKPNIKVSMVVTTLYRREFLIKENCWFDPKIYGQEDTLWTFDLRLKDCKCIRYNGCVYLYRKSVNSITHSFGGKKWYQAMKDLYVAYKDRLTWDNLSEDKINEINIRLNHCCESITLTLSYLNDEKFVREEFKQLKKAGIYPYKFRKDVFKEYKSLFRKCLDYLMPIEPVFWFCHRLYVLFFKIREMRSSKK